MRWVVVAALGIAGCGLPDAREVAARTPQAEAVAGAQAGTVPTFVGPMLGFVSDPACGPAVVPPAPAGRYPGPCSIVRDAGPYPGADGVWQEQFTYDDAGREIAWTNGFENQAWTYDDAGRLVSKRGCGVTHCAGFDATYDAQGRLAEYDEFAAEYYSNYTYHYDDAGHLSSAHFRGDLIDDATLHYVVDDAGQPTSIAWDLPDGGEFKDEVITYDSAERPVLHAWNAAPGNPFGLVSITESWTYDGAGQVLTDVRSDASGVERHAYTYDLDKLVAEHDEQPGLTTDHLWSYCTNGLLREHREAATSAPPDGPSSTAVTDELYAYGPWGLWSTDELTLPTPPAVSTRSFDAAGNVTRLVDELGHVWKYDYSCFQR